MKGNSTRGNRFPFGLDLPSKCACHTEKKQEIISLYKTSIKSAQCILFPLKEFYKHLKTVKPYLSAQFLFLLNKRGYQCCEGIYHVSKVKEEKNVPLQVQAWSPKEKSQTKPVSSMHSTWEEFCININVTQELRHSVSLWKTSMRCGDFLFLTGSGYWPECL